MKQYTRSIDRFSLGILLLSMTVVGCANSSRPEMGQSVTKIMNRQVANPNVAMQKHETTGTGLDAAQGEGDLSGSETKKPTYEVQGGGGRGSTTTGNDGVGG